MHRAGLLFRGLVIVAFVAALGASSARAQTAQPGANPAYGQQPQTQDQGATSQNSDDSREDNTSARPDQGESTDNTDSDQNNNDNNDGNDSDSSEQENQ